MSNTPPFFNDKSPLLAQKGKDSNADTVIRNNAFYPDIYLLDFQLRYRIDAAHAEERQIQAVQSAIIDINGQLKDWMLEQKEQGYEVIRDIDNGDDNCSEKVALYLIAVYTKAKANLVERYPELFFGKKDRSSKGGPDINTATHYHNEVRDALNKLTGELTINSGLI